ncbi:MAG: DUF2149 domain-containing protein [Aeromicrobium sp.]|nr:DUF2149 domain-containing protein [Aeromicrobium sp.]
MHPTPPRRSGVHGTYQSRRHRRFADHGGDPMEATGNLFDVALLIGIGFLIVALTAFGLQELISDDDVTIVKNPGTAEMEIIRKEAGRIERLRQTDQLGEGTGQAIGTVYRLDDGAVIWVPEGGLE